MDAVELFGSQLLFLQRLLLVLLASHFLVFTPLSHTRLKQCTKSIGVNATGDTSPAGNIGYRQPGTKYLISPPKLAKFLSSHVKKQFGFSAQTSLGPTTLPIRPTS